jgi:MFS family permease
VDTTTTAFAPPIADLDARRRKALIAGGVGLVLCAVGFVFDRDQFFRSWLIAYLLFLGIALGSMAFVMINHLSGGSWGVFRRVLEASSRTLPLLAILFLPVVLGMGSLYVWTHADHVQTDEILRHKQPYLNTAFFLARALLYFVCWILLAWTLTRLSSRQDEGDVSVNTTLQRVSGAGIVIYAMTVTFAGVDWVMSINPHWYSTLFGFLMIGGQGLAALAFTIVVSTFLVKTAPMNNLLKPHHFHDLGKLMFAFVMLWAYFNFSQYLLTYAANLVEEIPYFITRTSHGWQYLALFLVIFHFAVPWLLLLSRDRKRNPYRLVWVAVWMLVMRYLDIYILITPEFASTGENLHMLTGEHESHFFVHWLDLAAPLAIGGLWLWMFFTQLAQRPLFALGDPYLREAMETGGGH